MIRSVDEFSMTSRATARDQFESILAPQLYHCGRAELDYLHQIRERYVPPQRYNFIQPRFRSFLE